MRRIGLLGGSFNPITTAHVSMAVAAYKALDLDLLYWIVSPHNPLKDIRTLAPFEHRFNMAKECVDTLPYNMVVTDIEQRQNSSLTIHTLEAMRKQYPDAALIFIMGMDNWHSLFNGATGWDEYDRFMDLVSVAVLKRGGEKNIEDAFLTKAWANKRLGDLTQLQQHGQWFTIDNTATAISATNVRATLQSGHMPDTITAETYAYIKRHHLYGT